MDRIVADMSALQTVTHRFAGTEGERTMLHAVRSRFSEGTTGKIEGFVAHAIPARLFALHAGLLLAFGVLGFWFPLPAAVACATVTLSFLGEGTGRFGLLRWLFPRTPSYNLVVRHPAEPALGAVVLVAPLDVPAWRPLRRVGGRWRPMQLVFSAAMVVDVMLVLRSAAEPWGPRTLEIYVFALVVLGLSLALAAVSHRLGPPSDKAGDPATLLELIRRFEAEPLVGVDVWFAFVGCSNAFQGGMGAFLALHKKTLPDPCLVVSMDDVIRSPLYAVVSEGALFAQHHLPTGPALVERMRWAGVHVPPVDRASVTDARAARVRGYRAIAFAGGDGEGSAEGAHRAADVVETLARWYAQDLARVAHDRSSLEALAKATAGDGPVRGNFVRTAARIRAAVSSRRQGEPPAGSDTDPGVEETPG